MFYTDYFFIVSGPLCQSTQGRLFKKILNVLDKKEIYSSRGKHFV
ncbi:hypothetical protein LEP1GSC187_3767 [Leptospira santarosai str. ZUN179]|uniref:Uncharacterized protein n=1 Tax=Leptospira santarosai str. ZUN179 TaxID=1049985 RepID=M6UID6_9LEPT|nr:hypothetical protein LEP1GSC187_3767 [Leptospira santarosai str. ZUN179]